MQAIIIEHSHGDPVTNDSSIHDPCCCEQGGNRYWQSLDLLKSKVLHLLEPTQDERLVLDAGSQLRLPLRRYASVHRNKGLSFNARYSALPEARARRERTWVLGAHLPKHDVVNTWHKTPNQKSCM